MTGPIISPDWVATEELHLEVVEKIFSLSQDSFEVKDQNERAVVKIQGNVLSLRDSKEFLDPSGKPVLQMQSKILTMHATQEFKDMDGKLLFIVKQKSVLQIKDHIEVFLGGDKDDADFSIEGDLLGKEYNIVDAKTKAEVAQIKRSVFGGRNLLTGKDSYGVIVPAGTDILFALGIAVAADEIFNENK